MPGPGRGQGMGRGGGFRDSQRGVQQGMLGGRLRGHGHRMTGPRRVILSVLESAREYLSAEEVYMAVYADNPGVGIATVYRTLQMLAEIGIAERVDTGDGKARYKLGPVEDQRRRVVLVCTNCSRSTPITTRTGDTEAVIAQLERMTAEQYGFRTNRTVVQVYGLCEQCDKHYGG